MKTKQPMQPLRMKDGVLRFKDNLIVRHVLDFASDKGCDLNTIARLPFSKEDRRQFAQLIGYSLSGYSELPYVTDKAWEEACAADKTRKRKKRRK